MTLQMDKSILDIDTERILRIVESVQSKEQLEVALKCFFLFDIKHIPTNLTKPEKLFISFFKSKFWSIYKNKESKFSIIRVS